MSFDPLELPSYARITQKELENLVIKRVAFLYNRARLVNLKEAILEDFSERMKSKIRDQAALITVTKSNESPEKQVNENSTF